MIVDDVLTSCSQCLMYINGLPYIFPLVLAVLHAETKYMFRAIHLADIPAEVFAEVRVQLKLQWEAVLP